MTVLTPNPYLSAPEAHTLYEVLDATRVSTQALYLADRVTPGYYLGVMLSRLADTYSSGGTGRWAAGYGIAWEVARLAHAYVEWAHVDPLLAQFPGEDDDLDRVIREQADAVFRGDLVAADRGLIAVVYHPVIVAHLDRRRASHDTNEEALKYLGRAPRPWDEAREAVRPVEGMTLHLMHSLLLMERARVEAQAGD